MSHGPDPGVRCIVLTGFMGAGKSTVGPLLARRLGWGFVDFDQTIRARTGATPGEIIRERGEPAFRALEADLTRELSGRRDVVLAPGGGWAVRPELAEELGPGAVRVWLRISVAEVLRRVLADPTDRPLLGPPGGREERVAALLREREPAYAAAEIVVEVNGKEPGVLVDEIVRRIGQGEEEHGR